MHISLGATCDQGRPSGPAFFLFHLHFTSLNNLKFITADTAACLSRLPTAVPLPLTAAATAASAAAAVAVKLQTHHGSWNGGKLWLPGHRRSNAAHAGVLNEAAQTCAMAY